MLPQSMKESVDRIKQTLRWFPNCLLGLQRRIGKTSAILEIIHEDHDGNGTVFCMNAAMAAYAKQMYRDKYPNDPVPNFTNNTQRVVGRSDPIFADEWWDIPASDRRHLIATGRLKARIGTEFSLRYLDSSVIRFTDEELDCLEAMLEVLVEGGGNYMMLNLPEVVAVHRGLLNKFRKEKEEWRG